MDYLSTQPENLDGAKTHITELYMKNTLSLSKSSLALRAALEDAESSAALTTAKLTPANEGVLGTLGGLGIGFSGYLFTFAAGFWGFADTAAMNATVRAQVLKKSAEIEAISKEISKLATEAGRKAVKAGKISEKSYEEHVESISAASVVSSAIAGAVPVYNFFSMAGNTSDLEDKEKELKKKLAEFKAILKENNVKPGNESEDPSAAPAPGTEPAPAAEGGAAAPAEGEAASTAAPAEAPAAAPAEGEVAAPAEGEAAAAPAADASAAAAPVPADQATAGADADAAGAAAGQQAEAVSAEVEADRVEGEEIGADLAQAQTTQAATESLVDEINLLAKVSAGMESLAQSMEATKDFGGPAMQTQVMYRCAMEALCDVIEVRTPMTPALEEDANPAAKIDGADKAAKSNKGLVQRILDTIRAGLAKMGEWIKSAWKFVSSARARALQRAKKLQESVASATFKTEKIEGGTAKAVRNTGEFVTGLTKFSELTSHFSQPGTYAPYIALMDAAAFAVGKNNIVSEDDAAKNLQDMASVFAKGMNAGKGEEGTKVFEAPVTGGMVLKIVVPESIEKIGKFTTTVAVPEGAQLPEVTSVDPANKAQAEEMLKQIIATLELLEKTSDENGLKGVDEKLDAAAAKAKNGGTPAEDPQGTVAKAMQKIAGIFSSRAKLPVYAVARAYTGAANNALNLIATSTGAATEGEAKPAEAAKPAEGEAKPAEASAA